MDRFNSDPRQSGLLALPVDGLSLNCTHCSSVVGQSMDRINPILAESVQNGLDLRVW